MAGATRRPYRSLTTMRFVIIALILLGLGIWCLYLGGDDTKFWRSHKGLQVLFENLGGVLIVSTALGILWELIGKRSFAREVLETSLVSAEIETAGLKKIGTNYLTDAGWADLFKGAEKLDVFFAYGQTWRNTQLTHLQELSSRRNGRIRIYLADPRDDLTMTTLSERFQTDRQELTSKILETKKLFEDLRVPGGATIEVFYYAGDRVCGFYRFDGKAVITLYRHSKGRSIKLPTIVCEAGGSLYEYVRAELDYIDANSKPA